MGAFLTSCTTFLLDKPCNLGIDWCQTINARNIMLRNIHCFCLYVGFIYVGTQKKDNWIRNRFMFYKLINKWDGLDSLSKFLFITCTVFFSFWPLFCIDSKTRIVSYESRYCDIFCGVSFSDIYSGICNGICSSLH